ncbi:hypothetical protein ACOJVP_09535 [Mycobacterium sp. THU-M116]
MITQEMTPDGGSPDRCLRARGLVGADPIGFVTDRTGVRVLVCRRTDAGSLIDGPVRLAPDAAADCKMLLINSVCPPTMPAPRMRDTNCLTVRLAHDRGRGLTTSFNFSQLKNFY